MERQHEVTRLEGFSDAVFGFALTLLVVALDVPKNFAGLMNLMRGFLPFALMFAMICWLWYEHQQFFRRYGMQDAATISINCFLLFVVLFYVYPLKYVTMGLLGGWLGVTDPPELGNNSGAIMLMYSAGVVMIFGAFVALYTLAWTRRSALGLTPVQLVTLRFSRRGHIISMLHGVASVIVVFIAELTDQNNLYAAAGILYSLMGPFHAWNGFARGKARAIAEKQFAA